MLKDSKTIQETRIALRLDHSDVFAHSIVTAADVDRDKMIRRLERTREKPLWRMFFSDLIDPRRPGKIERKMAHSSQAAVDTTVQDAVTQAHSANDQCEVRARTHNPRNLTTWDAILEPEPSQVTITCSAEDCCMTGLKIVAERIAEELGTSRQAFAELQHNQV